MKPPSVFLLIRSLNVGGAERQLIHLAKGLAARDCEVTLATFYEGVLDPEAAASGATLVHLGKKGRWDTVPFMLRLIRTIRRARPDALYCFLGTANILGALARPFVPPIRLAWSVRASNMDLSRYDWLARASYGLEVRLSRRADVIISNSNAGAEFAIAQGFPRGRMEVVENGIDTDRFQPSPAARARLRAEWGVSDADVLVGVLARLDPMKGHDVFLSAAAKVAAGRPLVRFAIVGHGSDEELAGLSAAAAGLGIADRLLLPGRSDRPAETLSAFDVYCSASTFGEGFSNSVAEAMACGLPPVVTDVGDSARIVEGVGRTAPPGDADALAAALAETIDSLDRWDPATSRQRIVERYSIDRMVDRTLALLDDHTR